MDAVTLALMQYSASSGGGTTQKTVTGNAPITLSDASAQPIVSLTQTGLCTQADTPTPSAPVDIKCNNGVLKLVDDELPAGFKRLASIKFDGDFWYETGEVMTGNDDVTMTLSGTVTTGQNVFGSYNGTSPGAKNFSLYLYGGGSTSNCYLRYGVQLLRPRFGSGERTITFGKSGTSGFSIDVTVEPDTFTTEAGAFIGMLPNSSSPAYTGSIVGNILVGTRLKWIPCERESDGVVGYYEAVKGVFLEPVGTGTPTKGSYDTSHLTVLSVVGNPEVLTVSASGEADQTATVESLLSVGTVADEQNIISGAVIRRCAVCCYNGTQPIGDVYMSTTGGKDLGAIIVYPLDEPVTDEVTAQPLNTSEGTNIVCETAEVSPIALEAVYKSGSGSGSSSIWLLQCILRTSQRKGKP